MLTITPEAGLAINRMAAEQGAPHDGGLRIEAMHGVERPDFAISIATMPDENDQIVTEESTGARVMLDPLTAEFTEESILDVDDTVESALRFRLRSRGNER
ncbi:MAG TPA: hypothetical protein VFV67_30475 [Actinophytocola sp.]|uniref:hypothetical protein n=1 Tax=Actinophytocola sp. TaxID=1872138 RepID=UPI002DB8B3B7|nr:hypothetical protein [Actinophytocola sp.]HEU5474990.1 hypothetical protein [Actinophytocola sp.]